MIRIICASVLKSAGVGFELSVDARKRNEMSGYRSLRRKRNQI